VLLAFTKSNAWLSVSGHDWRGEFARPVGIRNKVSDSSNSAFSAVFWTLLGAIAGWGVGALFTNFHSLAMWLFVLTSISSIAIFAIILRHVPTSAKYSRQNYDAIVDHCEKTQTILDELLKQRAQIIPRELIYFEMARVIREAKETVAVITYFMYDWDANKRTFLPPDKQKVPGLEDFYKAIYECIKRPDVSYLRVWQAPADKHAELPRILRENPFHEKEIELIKEISRDYPDKAQFVIAEQHTTASYILVDRRNLFFNVDFYSTEERIWYSPYMIFIKDATENAFAGLNSIISRLTSRMSNLNG
jgi:hypothetical protein